MSRQEELERIVIESGSLIERLKECQKRIGKMCSEERPPKMTIPVQWNDDDFFISTTLQDAITILLNLQITPPMKYWQHGETGRLCAMPIQPSERWDEVTKDFYDMTTPS